MECEGGSLSCLPAGSLAARGLAVRSYVLASWGVCQQYTGIVRDDVVRAYAFEATVQSAVKALIARGYTGGQVMTK